MSKARSFEKAAEHLVRLMSGESHQALIYPPSFHSLPCDGSKKDQCNGACFTTETIRKNYGV